MNTESPILEVDHLIVQFHVRGGLLAGQRTVHAVSDVSLTIGRGESVGLVGESGCGKSSLARAVLRLVRPASGTVRFMGRDLATLSGREMRKTRRLMQMVFQDPLSSLNPTMSVERIVGEPIAIHHLAVGAARSDRVEHLLSVVGLAGVNRRLLPGAFSGGQRQRIAIARALASEPALIVCDEAVSSLDVSIQAQVLNLLVDLQAGFGLSYLFISHDLGVIRHVADRVAVMYLGKIVELARADDLFASPLHPYSKALIAAVAIPDPPLERSRPKVMARGEPASPLSPPPGCRFHTRCPFATDICKTAEPPLELAADGHAVACHHWKDIAAGRIASTLAASA
jgi:oligopeptide transport system ATP-binding protein